MANTSSGKLAVVRLAHGMVSEIFGAFEAPVAVRLAAELDAAQKAIPVADGGTRYRWDTWAIGDESDARASIAESQRRARHDAVHANRQRVESELSDLRKLAKQSPEMGASVADAIAKKEQELAASIQAIKNLWDSEAVAR